jgi:hypothetical protein
VFSTQVLYDWQIMMVTTLSVSCFSWCGGGMNTQCVWGVTCDQWQRHRRRYSNNCTLRQPKEQEKQNPGACSRLQRLHQAGQLESRAVSRGHCFCDWHVIQQGAL